MQHHIDKNKVIPSQLNSFMNKKVASDNELHPVKIEAKDEETKPTNTLNSFLVKK